jgi:hypothetical protein
MVAFPASFLFFLGGWPNDFTKAPSEQPAFRIAGSRHLTME